MNLCPWPLTPCPLLPQGDLGGKKILQKKWTSFLKARLICHIPQYETLRSVCSLQADTSAHTHFYAAFTLTTQWSVQGWWEGKGWGQHRGWSRGQGR